MVELVAGWVGDGGKVVVLREEGCGFGAEEAGEVSFEEGGERVFGFAVWRERDEVCGSDLRGGQARRVEGGTGTG